MSFQDDLAMRGPPPPSRDEIGLAAERSSNGEAGVFGGDVDEGNSWLERHPSLYEYVLWQAKLWTLCEETACDWAQQACLAFVEKERGLTFNSLPPIKTYLLRCLRSAMKKQRRYHERLAGDRDPEFLENRTSDEPADVLICHERLAMLRMSIASLDSRDREIIESKYFGDEPDESIAEKVGLKKESISMTQLRILKTLKQRLKSLGYER